MTTYENANEALPDLMRLVLNRGTEVESRNGLTKELIMQQVTLRNPVPAEITVPGRHVSLPAQIAETMWLLAGRNDIEWLSNYLPRAADFSDDGKTWRGGYGPRLRKWQVADNQHQDIYVDQLAHVVDLLKVTNPDTRRAVINIYNPAIDTQPGKDIPCNNWVHFIPRDGVLHAHVAIRSNDLMWGWSGINAFEWTTLLTIVAGLTELQRGSITFSISSLHLYQKHWGKASDIVSESAGASPLEHVVANPEFFFEGSLSDFDDLVHDWFRVEAMIREGKGFVDNLINGFPEPMLRSWLIVLQSWHRGNMQYAEELKGTSLYHALALSPRKKLTLAQQAAADAPTRAAFTRFTAELHAEKHKAYGNSWKKRGEMLGIMANCARKVDRLGVAGGGDTAADTAIDLLVYFIKYELWLYQGYRAHPGGADITEGAAHHEAVVDKLQHLGHRGTGMEHLTDPELIALVNDKFNTLEHWVEEKRIDRQQLVEELQLTVYPLAVRLWKKEQEHLVKRDLMLQNNATRQFTGYAQEGEV